MTQPIRRTLERCAWTQQRSERVEAISVPAVDWLGRSKGTATAHVLPEYALRLRRYAELRSRYLRLSVPFVLALIAILVAMAMLGQPHFVGVTLLVMACLMWALPFATPQTVETFGVGKSIVFARGGAIAVAGIGLVYLL